MRASTSGHGPASRADGCGRAGGRATVVGRASPAGSSRLPAGRRRPRGPDRRPARPRDAPSSSTCPAPRRTPPRSCCCTRWAARRTSAGSPPLGELSRTLPRGHLRPALARPRHPVRPVPVRRLRRRRGGGHGRARHRPGRGRRLLDGRRGRPAELWHRHPRAGRPGWCSCSTARNFRGHKREQFFFPLMTAGDEPAVPGRASPRSSSSRSGCRTCPPYDARDRSAGAPREFRSTSAWSMPEVLGELGRFNSAPWIGEVDVPTAVVVTGKDKAIPARRQRGWPRRSTAPQVLEAPGGHASVVMDHAGWFPVFLEAVAGRDGADARRAAGRPWVRAAARSSGPRRRG